MPVAAVEAVLVEQQKWAKQRQERAEEQYHIKR